MIITNLAQGDEERIISLLCSFTMLWWSDFSVEMMIVL
jgi:hypothetical protein